MPGNRHAHIVAKECQGIGELALQRNLPQFLPTIDIPHAQATFATDMMRILNREGIQIARRTVAKYRDELAIPSSNDRKQIF